MTAFPTFHPVRPLKVTSSATVIDRHVPDEAAVAIVCNGTTMAVMMATPSDLEDFAVGFALSERVVSHVSEIERIDIVSHPKGIEARLWVAPDRAQAMIARRRRMAGPTGCGLCGIESLDEASRPLPFVPTPMHVDAADLRAAMAQLRDLQRLNALTRAVHAAALWNPETGHGCVREDVGRHNAVDKLIGALARENGAFGALLLTSRVSIELVQKAALAGLPIVAAVSVPTKAAIQTAEQTGITLVGIARDDGFEVFTCPERISV